MELIKETNLRFGVLSKQSPPKKIVIHHIGDPCRDVEAADVHRWHLNAGWSGIGYHFLIKRDGTIERGRPEWAVGSHAYQFNHGTLGINFVGNMEIMTPTPAQIEAGAMLLADLCLRYELTPDENTIVGHKDLMPTACPGKNLVALMDTLRGKAFFYMQNKCW